MIYISTLVDVYFSRNERITVVKNLKNKYICQQKRFPPFISIPFTIQTKNSNINQSIIFPPSSIFDSFHYVSHPYMIMLLKTIGNQH